MVQAEEQVGLEAPCCRGRLVVALRCLIHLLLNFIGGPPFPESSSLPLPPRRGRQPREEVWGEREGARTGVDFPELPDDGKTDGIRMAGGGERTRSSALRGKDNGFPTAG